MDSFIAKHQQHITGVLHCPDRLICKGYLPISWTNGMEFFLQKNHCLIKDFKPFVLKHSERVKQHAKDMAHRHARPYIYLMQRVDKEACARRIAERDKIEEGLICVLAAVEACHSYHMQGGQDRPRLAFGMRKCLCLYFYFMDADLGFIRILCVRTHNVRYV